MSNSLSTRLQELKPMLPFRYQRILAETLGDVELWRIKNAFAGRPMPTEMKRKIFNAAVNLAKQRLEEQVQDKEVIEDLKKIAALAE